MSKLTSLVKFTKGVVKVPLKRLLPTCSSRAILPGTDVEASWKVGRPELMVTSWGVYCEETDLPRLASKTE